MDSPEIVVTTTYNAGSRTLWIIIALTIALLIIFGIAIWVFFAFFNPPAMHEIIVNNNCSHNINVLFGAVTTNQSIEFFPVIKLSPKQTHLYKATPGTSIIVQGYKDNDMILINNVNPFTTAELTLAGQGFVGKHQVTNGNIIITDLHITANSTDKYGISLQGGYNIPISISVHHNSNNPSCPSAGSWNHLITATGPNSCPEELQSPGTGANYQVCLNPCTMIGGTAYCCTQSGACSTTGGCEQLWPELDYYTVFANACPTCLITNCDDPHFTCTSTRDLTSYSINFCP